MSFHRKHPQSGGGPRRLASFLALFVLFVAGASLVEAQEQTFVCFEANGFPGESLDANHIDWIDAFGIDHGGSSPFGVSTVTLTDVAILKGTDRSSVRLHQMMVEGIVEPKVVIDVCRVGGGGAQECYSKLVLENVKVVQMDVAGSACVDTGTSCTPAQTESVSLGYEKITWVYQTSALGPFSYCFDTLGMGACSAMPTTDCTPQ